MSNGWKSIVQGVNPLQIVFADSRPLTRVLGYIFYRLFSLDSLPLAIYSIFLHFINTVLVYFIVVKLIKNKLYALLGSLYFAVADVAHQTVTWFGASFGAQPASVLIFMSIVIFLSFLENKKKLFLYASFFFAVISIYFKENGIFLFPLFIIILLYMRKSFPIKKHIKYYTISISFLCLFVAFRLFEMLATAAPYQPSVYINSVSSNIPLIMLARVILYPLTSFSLSFIAYPIGISLSEWLWKLYYPFITQRPDVVFLTAILDLIAIVFTGFLLVVCYFIAKKKTLTNAVIFSLFFFILSILPYIAISKVFAYMEPRYYYVSLLSCAIIIAGFFSFIQSKLKRFLKIFVLIFLFIYLLYLRYNIGIIRSDIAVQVDLANERRSFMHQLYSYLPTLRDNTNVFLFIGSKPYVVDNNFTPFQNGFGYTLMVLYYKSGKIPHLLPTTQYLWDLGEEGIKTIHGNTFGYFNNLQDMKRELGKRHIDVAFVHAFYYDFNTKKLSDITQQTEKEITNDE